MIGKNELVSIIESGGKKHHDITVRDVSFVMLCSIYNDESIAYKSVFGASDMPYTEYVESAKVKWLRKHIKENYATNKDDIEITFLENRNAMFKLIEDARKSFENKEIDANQLYNIEKDIRVKLNDKFKVQDDTKDQIVVVETKYNHICERFHCECYLPTVEDLKKMYNLVEKQ